MNNIIKGDYIPPKYEKKQTSIMKLTNEGITLTATSSMTKLEYDETNPKETMNLDLYQKLAAVTLNKDINQEQSLANYALGLTGEAGEVADVIKKHVFHKHELDRVELEKELGDVLWYIAGIATVLGTDLSQIANKNILKLAARYPEGFDSVRSINRVE